MELQKLIKVIVNLTTAMPFRFHSNRFTCFFCSGDFYESSDLLEHVKTEHEDYKIDDFKRRGLTKRFNNNPCIHLDINNFACKVCGTELSDPDDLIDHLNENHALVFDKNISHYVLTFKLTDNQNLNCLQCGEKFKFFGPLLRHVNLNHNKITLCLCEICGRGFRCQKAVDKHVELTHSKVEKRCNKCNEIFPTASKLVTHIEKAHKYGFRCWECAEIFPSRYTKKLHLATVHNMKDFRFPCPDCDNLYVYKSRLLKHQSRVHAKEKNETCQVCGFKSFDMQELRRHMVCHSDARPYECTYCSKAFQRRRNLKVHLRTHEK